MLTIQFTYLLFCYQFNYSQLPMDTHERGTRQQWKLTASCAGLIGAQLAYQQKILILCKIVRAHLVCVHLWAHKCKEDEQIQKMRRRLELRSSREAEGRFVQPAEDLGGI